MKTSWLRSKGRPRRERGGLQRPRASLKPHALHLGLHAEEEHVGGDVEGGAVVAEGAVAGGLAGEDGAEVLAFFGEDEDAAG